MRLVKVFLGAGLIAGLVAVVAYRQPVSAAYQSAGTEPATLAFSGLDLDVELTPMGESPYVVDTAPDTRTASTGLTVHGRPPSPPTMSGGSSVLTGTVVGATGPVPAATVRVERAVDDGLAVAELSTDADGVYRLPAILGGRYRVRAWQAGTATMATSQVLFLGHGEERALDLVVETVAPEPRIAFTHRGDVYVGLTGSVAVSVTTRSVGPDGLIELNGVAGAAIAFTPSANVTANAAEVATDASGVAPFLIECRQAGPASAVVTVGDRRATATLPTCRELPIAAVGDAEGQPGVDQPVIPELGRDLVHEVLATEVVGVD